MCIFWTSGWNWITQRTDARKQMTHQLLLENDKFWNTGVRVSWFGWVCVFLYFTHSCTKILFDYHVEDILAQTFKGLFEGEDMLLRLRLVLRLGWGEVVGMVMVRGWVIHYVYESPHKDRSRRERERERETARTCVCNINSVCEWLVWTPRMPMYFRQYVNSQWRLRCLILCTLR